MFFGTFFSSAQSITIYAENTAYGTGFVRSSGVKTSGNMQVSTSTTYGRGWAKFDLSAVPANATITGVTLGFYTFTSTTTFTNNTITGFAQDPIFSTGGTLYNNIGNSTIYNTSTWSGSGWQTKSLNSTVYSLVQSNIGNSVTFGFIRGSAQLYQIYGYSSTFKPYITIQYTLSTLPPASPSSITSSLFGEETTCQNFPVGLTANNSIGATYWFEDSCGTTNPFSTGNNITVNPQDTTTYFARNYENGLWSPNCASITINVLAPPIISPNDTICLGEVSTISASGNYDYYSWSNGSSTSSISVSPISTTNYTVTANNFFYDCFVTEQVQVVVNPLPIINAGNDIALCYDFTDFNIIPITPGNGFWLGTGIDSAGFYSNHTLGTNSVIYKVIDANNCKKTDTLMVSISGNPLADFVYNSNTFCIDGTNPTPTVLFSQGGTFSCDNCVIDPFSGNIDLTSSGEGVFNVSYTDANNCGNPIIKTITIVSSTQSSFSYIDVMCQDHSISPTLNSNSTIGIFTSTPNLNSLNLNSGEIDLTLETPGIYSISNTIITDGSCFSSQFSFNIEIFALPTVQITYADNILCLGDTVFMQANGASSYEWNNVLGTNSSVFDVPNTNKTYILKGIDLNSCENFDTLLVDVNNYPTLITSASQNICIGDSITLTASGAPFLNWNNSLPQGGSNLVFPTSTTQYQIIGIDENNCQDTSSILITVNSIDVANFNYNSSLFCIDDTNPFPINNGTPNGVFSGNTVINSNTGEIDLLNSGNGDFIVVYQTPGYCFRIDTFEVKIVDNFITDFSIPTSNCQVGNVFPVMTNNGLIGTFSSTPIGLNIDSQSGLINFELSANGIYSVTNTITGTGTCATSQYSNTIEILQSPIVNLNFQNDTAICIGQNLNLVANGATNFGWNNGLGVGANKTITPSTNTTVIVIGTNINGCNDADTLQVQINSLPNVSAGSDITLCYNQSYLFSGSGALTYTWNNGMINNMSWNATISSSFTVIGTDLNGCQNTDQMNINVNPLPNVFAGNDVAVCQNQNISLLGAGAVNYSWNNGIINGQSFIPSSTSTYTVIGTDLNGCQNSDQVTVSINPLPIINAGNDTVICQNSDIVLIGSGGVSYTWNNGVIDGQNFNPSSSLTYNVIGTDVNGCNNNDQVTVGVYNLPVVSSGNDFNICENSSVTLFGNGASTYIWNNGVLNGVAFNIQNSNVYTVTGTDVNGCQNTDQININVNPLPNVFAGNDVSVCQNQIISLSGAGALNYSWNNGIINGQSFIPSSTLTYSLIGTDVNGCQNSDQVFVSVNPLPIINAGNDTVICQNSDIVLTGSGGVSYTWNNGVIDGQNFNPTSSLTYGVIGTDANGCQNTDQVLININPLPSVFAGNDASICEGSTISLIGNGANTYTWNNGITNGIPFTIQDSTIYTVTGTDINGCQNTDQVQINVNPLPNVFAGNDVFICQNQSISLTGSGSSTINYSWDNGVIDGLSFIPTSSSTYSVIGTDIIGCQNSDQIIVSINTPITLTSTILPEVFGNDGSIDLTVNGNAPFIFDWGSNVLSNQINNEDLNYLQKGEYTIIISDNIGCILTQIFTIENKPDLFVPTGVSPNNDGKNDAWELLGSSFIPDLEVKIFNLQEQIIYSQSGNYTPWDCTFLGEKVPTQEYFYTISSLSLGLFKSGYLLVNN